MKYRKKPVVIDAILWNGSNIEEAVEFIKDGKPDLTHLPDDGISVGPTIGFIPASGDLLIPTLEGKMTARAGDIIIRGVNGEFYPCKPDIFEKTYEKVEE